MTLSIPDETTWEVAASVLDDPPSQPQAADARFVPLFDREVPVYDGLTFIGGESLRGPMLIEEKDTVIVVPPSASLIFDRQVGVYVMTLGAA